MWPEAPAPSIPPPPSLLPLLGGMLLWLGIFVVLFVLPPCWTSPGLDRVALLGAGGWGLWRLVRLLAPRPRTPAQLTAVAPAPGGPPEAA